MNRASWEVGPHTAHAFTPTLDVLVGYGYACTSNLHVELTPFVGYGRAYHEIDDIGNSNDWDHYFEYGAKLGAYVVVDSRLQLGLEIPFLVGRIDPDLTYEDGDHIVRMTLDERRRCQGIGLLATIGYRF
jgi:hypothetical protein